MVVLAPQQSWRPFAIHWINLYVFLFSLGLTNCRRIGTPQGLLPRSTSIDSIILQTATAAPADTTSATATAAATGESLNYHPSSVSFANTNTSSGSSPHQHPQFLQVMNPANSRRESLLSPSSGRRAKQPERGIAGEWKLVGRREGKFLPR